MPVVCSLIRSADLEKVDVGWGPRQPLLGFWEFLSDRPAPEDGLGGLYVFEPDPAQQPTLLQADDELWIASSDVWLSSTMEANRFPPTTWATR
jgi:hypothetical protein